MSPPFSNVNLLRIIQESESLFDKPGSEEFLSQLRENWEVLAMLMLYTGDSGTATENPTETVLTDGNAAYDADEHDGRSLVIIDGLAAGNIYEIDATAATKLTCTGDTLLADGVRSGDAYKIFYNLKHATAHTHDNIDSPHPALGDNTVTQAKMADSAIGQAELKSTTQSQSQDIGSSTQHTFTLTGGQYCFKETVRGETTAIQYPSRQNVTTGYTTRVPFFNTDSVNARFAYVIHRYMQASGEVYWIFILRDKITKENIGISACSDHPCFGNSQDPEAEPHMFGDAYDPAKHEIIVINPSPDEVLELEKKTTPNKSVVEVIAESYEVDDTIEPNWPNIPVTIGLPPDWEEKQMGEMITPIRKIIPKPAYIKTATLKLKV